MTSVKSLSTKVYVEPKLQAEIDFHAGILAAHEKDYDLAYSYFYEAFDTFSLPSVNNSESALRALKLMILVKIIGDKLEDIHNIVYGKMGLKFAGADIDALRAIENSVKKRSVVIMKESIGKYSESLFIR